MNTSAFKLGFVHILRGIFLDILYFPIWWLTRGVKRSVLNGWYWISGFAQRYALLILAQNLFRPMFGQRDWQSRLISFFVRFVQLAVLFAAWILWSALVILITLFVIVLPALIVWEVLYQLRVLEIHPLFWYSDL